MMIRVDQRNTVVKLLVSNFQDLLNIIDLLDFNNCWTITETKYKSLFFVKIVISGQYIEQTLKIEESLNTQAFYKFPTLAL